MSLKRSYLGINVWKGLNVKYFFRCKSNIIKLGSFIYTGHVFYTCKCTLYYMYTFSQPSVGLFIICNTFDVLLLTSRRRIDINNSDFKLL